jgi:hypothetical protein
LVNRGDPNAPVIDKTDPPGQYCNPVAETCDAAIMSPGSCFIDITTHSYVCDYSNKEEASPGGESTIEASETTCDPNADPNCTTKPSE